MFQQSSALFLAHNIEGETPSHYGQPSFISGKAIVRSENRKPVGPKAQIQCSNKVAVALGPLTRKYTSDQVLSLLEELYIKALEGDKTALNIFSSVLGAE